MSDHDIEEIFECFMVESQEVLDSLAQDFVELESNRGNEDLLNRIFRGFHTLKGAAGFMGFDSIAAITHHAEDLLNTLRRNEFALSPETIDVLFEVHDCIQHIIKNAGQSDDKASVDYNSTINKLIAMSNPAAASDVNELAESTALLCGNPEISGDFSDDSSVEEVMLMQPSLKYNAELIRQYSPAATELPEVDAKEKISNRGRSENSTQVTTEKSLKFQKQNNQVAANATTRVDISKIETMMDLTGELSMAKNRLLQITAQINQQLDSVPIISELMAATSQLDKITMSIQGSAMRLSMAPISRLYQKIPRIVRELAKGFGKEIELVLKGGDIEIERTIVEALHAPLMHMIRNSCDHGVEKSEERQRNNKSTKAQIVIETYQEENYIVLRVSDDGRGLNTKKILDIAFKNNVLSPEEAEKLSEQEVMHLVFLPGFSTAEFVSTVSGRGVGMDVVNSNIKKLNGVIEIDSTINQGVTFTIKLPKTRLYVECSQ